MMLNKNCGSQKILPDFQYEKFRITLETKKINFKLRGKKLVSSDIISGNICMFDDDKSVKSTSTTSSRLQDLGSCISNKLVTTLKHLYKSG